MAMTDTAPGTAAKTAPSASIGGGVMMLLGSLAMIAGGLTMLFTKNPLLAITAAGFFAGGCAFLAGGWVCRTLRLEIRRGA